MIVPLLEARWALFTGVVAVDTRLCSFRPTFTAISSGSKSILIEED